jgi:hypothetical protein
VSAFGTNAYGQNVYGGPAVWSASVPEAASAADIEDAVAIVPVIEAGSASDATDIVLYVQAPLPSHHPARMRTYLRR